MSRKATPKQATTLEHLTEWVRAVQAAHPDKIKHVTDDALLGLQTLHSTVVREIMQEAVEIEENDQESGRSKKRRAVEILDQAHHNLGLTDEWQQALSLQEESKKEAPVPTKMTKAQRKRARKTIDPTLLKQQEMMLQQSKERALQQKEAG